MTLATMIRFATHAGRLIAVAIGLACATQAFAFQDSDSNKIDDSIDAVHSGGWNAAFENGDPTRRMLIGVASPAAIVYAVYVGYDHRPGPLDETALSALGLAMVWPFQYIDYIESRATWSQIQQITALPGVTRVEAIPVMYATNHYGSRTVRARDSRGIAAAENYVLFPSVKQELGFDGTGVVIGVLDTGVNDDVDQFNAGYPGHESLKGKFLGGGEFFSGQPALNTPFASSMNPQDHGSEASSYHATHVAGSAMGTGGPGGYFAGVAPGARLVDCKVLSDAGASVGGAARGMEWCIANRNTLWAGLPAGSPWQGIDVLNLSLGSPQSNSNGTDATARLVNACVRAGMVVCLASGNDSQAPGIATPASADSGICVGASATSRTLDRSDDRVTSFSNEGPRLDDGDADHFDEMKPDIVTPGAGILSAHGDVTSDGSDYQQLSGTSMASPHAAGCAALVLQANPALTPMQVRSILRNTAEHNVATVKATGDRGQDPYGLDANYDPSCGWGLVDVHAACKEALNSLTGVQVNQERAVARPVSSAIDFTWITQREYPFLGFHVHRAPDAGGAPGTFTTLTGSPIAPSAAGDPLLQGDDNRTPYRYVDSGPGLVLGNTYWYMVSWVDLLGVPHAEPPVPVAFGQLPRVATAYYSIVHNAVDNDLLVRVGVDLDYNPGNLGQADFEVLGPGEARQDSSRVQLGTVPANAGSSALGTIEHFWSVGFFTGDGIGGYLPPNAAHPWFLSVVDAGYVNRTGRVTSFSMFVNDAPGSASGTTFVTNHTPMPQPTGEGGVAPALLFIPEPQPTATAVARMWAENAENGVRLMLELVREDPAARAVVYRSQTDDFDSRVELTREPLAFNGTRVEFVDTSAEPGRTYSYWIALHDGQGGAVWSGPVSGTTSGAVSMTFAAPAAPNPVRDGAVFEYAIGYDVAHGGAVDVALRLHDIHGRTVRTLHTARESVGRYRVSWNARDDRGTRVAPGLYFLRMTAGGVTHNQRVTVLR